MEVKQTQGDLGTERALLSSICQLGDEAYYESADIIDIEAFTNESNQAIFKCIHDIVEDKNKVDIPTLIAKAEQLNLTRLVCKEKTDIEYIKALFQFPVKFDNIRNHAKKLGKLQLIRNAKKKHLQAIQDLDGLDGPRS